MQDPRFTTVFNYQQVTPETVRDGLDGIIVPAVIFEQVCRPGYYPRRPDKGTMLTVNNYGIQPVQLAGGNWARQVYTPFPDEKNSPITLFW